MAADKISLQKLCDELDVESGIKVEEDIKFCKRLGPGSENSRMAAYYRLDSKMCRLARNSSATNTS